MSQAMASEQRLLRVTSAGLSAVHLRQVLLYSTVTDSMGVKAMRAAADVLEIMWMYDIYYVHAVATGFSPEGNKE